MCRPTTRKSRSSRVNLLVATPELAPDNRKSPRKTPCRGIPTRQWSDTDRWITDSNNMHTDNDYTYIVTTCRCQSLSVFMFPFSSLSLETRCHRTQCMLTSQSWQRSGNGSSRLASEGAAVTLEDSEREDGSRTTRCAAD